MLCMGSIAVFTTGLVQRLLLLIGLLLAYFIYYILSNVMGWDCNFAPIQQAGWFGVPSFHAPVFDTNAMLIIAPIALIAENLGHIKAVSAMTGETWIRILVKPLWQTGLLLLWQVVWAHRV